MRQLFVQRYRVLLAVLLSLFLAAPVLARSSRSGGDVYVRGYTRRDGTYVQPHYRSAPDGNFYNNWSTKGNVNPYTGQPGTKVTPPPGYGGYGYSYRSTPSGSSTDRIPSLAELDLALRQLQGVALERYGVKLDWRQYSSDTLDQWLQLCQRGHAELVKASLGLVNQSSAPANSLHPRLRQYLQDSSQDQRAQPSPTYAPAPPQKFWIGWDRARITNDYMWSTGQIKDGDMRLQQEIKNDSPYVITRVDFKVCFFKDGAKVGERCVTGYSPDKEYSRETTPIHPGFSGPLVVRTPQIPGSNSVSVYVLGAEGVEVKK